MRMTREEVFEDLGEDHRIPAIKIFEMLDNGRDYKLKEIVSKTGVDSEGAGWILNYLTTQGVIKETHLKGKTGSTYSLHPMYRTNGQAN